MCGIAGIVSEDGRRADEARLVRMRDVLRHRGPDGAGLRVDGGVGLAHRRLSIVDVAGGGQPIGNEDGSVWVVFNGEIYNHAPLRAELEEKGHRYRTRTDTETIVHLYEEEADDCVLRLDGMFAFALWDGARRRLLLARDRLGIKPLYYAWTNEGLLFASEIKALLAGGVRARLRREALPSLLANRYVSADETLFDGIHRLPPGHVLSWTLGEPAVTRRYWQLPDPADVRPGSLPALAGELRTRLSAAVRSHLMSDVPVGLFLSGGLDSTAILGLMAETVGRGVPTFSVAFAEAGFSELEYARLAARAAGAEHHEVVVSADQFFEALPTLIWHEDEPIAFPSSVPLYFVSRLAAERVKVVLTGEGSDELFLGYNRYRVTAWNDRVGSSFHRWLPAGASGAVRAAMRRLPRPMRRYAERSFLGLAPGPRSLFFDNFAVFSEGMQAALWARSGATPRDPYGEGMRLLLETDADLLQRMSRTDVQTYLVELLMKQDQMSMAASVESRVPFLDRQLVEFALSLPGGVKLRGFQGKAILRRAVADLVPPAILTRRKAGFPVPIGSWLRGRYGRWLDSVVLSPRALDRGLFDPATLRRLVHEHRHGLAAHDDRLWLLLNIEIWQRIFIEGEDAVSVMRAA